MALLRKAINALCQHGSLAVCQAPSLEHRGATVSAATCVECGASWRDNGAGMSVCERKESA